MEVFVLNEMKTFSKEKMKKVKLFDSKNFFCDLYCLKPGQSQKIHAHQGADKIYFVLEGIGDFSIGDKKKSLKNGTAVIAPSEVLHGVVNNSDSNLTLLVFMAPNPNRND